MSRSALAELLRARHAPTTTTTKSLGVAKRSSKIVITPSTTVGAMLPSVTSEFDKGM